jgi:hypothetical protein
MQDAVNESTAAAEAAPTSWPPRPNLELVSRLARRWVNTGDHFRGRSAKFEPDFSQVASAVDSVRDALRSGRAGVERPPRESVSGTYFFRRVESGQPVGALGGGAGLDGDGAGLGASFGDAHFANAHTAPSHGAPFCNSLGGGGGFAFGEPRTRSARFSLGARFSGVGSGGRATSKRVTAVFKPADEEPADSSPTDSPASSPSPVHPRASPDFADGGSRAARMAAAGFTPGEGAYKEVAAYLLDHNNFSRVPQTALARCTIAGRDDKTVAVTGDAEANDDGKLQTKMGAFQVFVENVGDADDWGPGLFPRDSVHRIAVLDLRTLNYDRHGGNILVTKDDSGRYDLVPIDHAFTLPETVQAVPWACWMDWPAAKAPMSQETLDYIASLETDLDVRLLVEELDGAIRPRSMRSLRIATTLLQHGAAAGLTLYDIGELIYTREGDGAAAKSPLEKIVDEVVEAGERRMDHMPNIYEPDARPAGSPPNESFFRLDGGTLPPPSPPPPTHPHLHNEQYIIRRATRKIDELVRSVVESKESGSGGRHLGRARSMHDFGFNLGVSAASAHGTLFSTLPVGAFDACEDRAPFSLKFSPSPPPPGESATAPTSIGVSFAAGREAKASIGKGKSSPVSPHELGWETDSLST